LLLVSSFRLGTKLKGPGGQTVSLAKLIDLVPPPPVPFEPATKSMWKVAQKALGFRLPQDYYDFSVTYGSGEFTCSDGRYIQILNPVSKRQRHSYVNLQESYREVKQHQARASFPYDLFPAVPGLYTIGGATSPIAFFYLIEPAKTDYSIVARTFQKRWATNQPGLIAFLVALLTDQKSIWTGAADPSGGTGAPIWSFVAEKAAGTTPTAQFHEAVLLGDLDQIRKIAARGVDMDAKDSSGNTPLCRTENPDVIELLLSLGADPNAPCDDERAPLIVALTSQTPLSTIQALLHAGANPNTADGFGMTPLMHASKNSDIEIVKALLAAGADVNAADKLGTTALHAARKRPPILALLRQSGGTSSLSDNAFPNGV
jgi:hypothetical protein